LLRTGHTPGETTKDGGPPDHPRAPPTHPPGGERGIVAPKKKPPRHKAIRQRIEVPEFIGQDALQALLRLCQRRSGSRRADVPQEVGGLRSKQGGELCPCGTERLLVLHVPVPSSTRALRASPGRPLL